jgi:5-methylcytosine-specific restriction protein A
MIQIKKGAILVPNRLVELFKCSGQGGMRRSHKTNTLVIVSNHIRSIYSDKWYGDELHYTGMGSSGDQSLSSAQNKTLHECNVNGIEVHLFEVFEEKQYTYQGVVAYQGKAYQEVQTDIDGHQRKVWMFPLNLKDNTPVRINDKVIQKLEEKKQKSFKKLSKHQIKRLGESKKKKKQSYRNIETKSYDRDEYVKLYALLRAGENCQLCENPAPFLKKDGSPYLEVHHIDYLASGGSDSIDNVVAICPNCHRKMHSFEIQNDISKLKKLAIEKLEY